jgi:hypothetical protein
MKIPDLLRVIHLVAAVVLGVLIYPAWADDSSAIWIMRLAAFPILTLTGAALWIGRVKAMGHARANGATP